jgi:Protein of unknown function (DUF1549)/Protein of unknown function (DUF1553)/Planctomycete cytochrome C/NPCBM/NEW2 domain
MHRWILLFLLPGALPAADPTVDFARDVHPILAERCFACHGGDKRAGGLSLRGYEEVLQGGRSGAVIVPGKPAESLLLRRVTADGTPVMPPIGQPLDPAQIKVLKNWVAEGARASLTAAAAKPRWVPELSLTKPGLPEGNGPAVDRWLEAYWREHAVTPAAVVPDAAFARRAYLDAWGLLPTPEQLRKFMSSTDNRKREALVDELLANKRQYSENWISFWNDLLRNDEGVNYANARKSITPWLQQSLEENLPYDKFVTALLNPTGPGAPEGFLTGVNWRGDVSASQLPVMQAAQNSAQVFLGVNLKCNSCHDSFISKWKLKDAYGLAAFFAEEPQLELVRCDIKTGQQTAAKFLYPALDLPEPPLSLAQRRSAVARMFIDPRNGRTPRTVVNRIWARLMGRGIVEQVDDMDAEPWDPQLLDWLAADLVEHQYDLKHLVRTIMTSRAYQMPGVPRGGEAKAYVFTGPEIRRLTAEQFVDNLSALTGEWRVYMRENATLGSYSREWHMGSTLLTRGLGRPIRDQVYTERDQSATTLQMLELVNGETLTHMLQTGARRMLGQLPAAPENMYDSGPIRDRVAPVDVDITGVKELHLVVGDNGSYSPERVLPVWAAAKLSGPGYSYLFWLPGLLPLLWLAKLGYVRLRGRGLQSASTGAGTGSNLWGGAIALGVAPLVFVALMGSGGEVLLSSLKPVSATKAVTDGGPVQMKKAAFDSGIRTGVNSEIVYNLEGRGFTRLRASAGLEQACLQDDISRSVRFFVFRQKPDFERLVKVAPELPVPAPTGAISSDALIERVFQFLLGRAATPRERTLAAAYLVEGSHAGAVSPDGLADLIWSVAMLPEFQLIQ